MHVSELWIFPIKSCRGIRVEQFALDDRGPEHDRRWMLVADNGQFVSQREAPRLSLVGVTLNAERITVSAPGMPDLAFGAAEAAGAVDCMVWNDRVELQHVGQGADEWFSTFIGSSCRLMRMPAGTERVVDLAYAPERRLVSLADAFPMLLIGTASLDLLNSKLSARGEEPLSMLRFRPNIVVTGTRPHEEDGWQWIRLGGVACRVVKPCARCVATTVDFETGTKGVEPLRTLASYRKHGSKVLFGQNVIHAAGGTIWVGDRVLVEARA